MSMSCREDNYVNDLEKRIEDLEQKLNDLRTAAEHELDKQCIGCMKNLPIDERWHVDSQDRSWVCDAPVFRAAIERSRQ